MKSYNISLSKSRFGFVDSNCLQNEGRFLSRQTSQTVNWRGWDEESSGG